MDACEDDIEQLDVRTMWQHEALDFTPWLAENLHILSVAIGLKLEPVQREVPVGPYFLDIKAKEADGGAIVAIENQLEMTDMGHLGQLLTYATGCEAHIAIWVAPAFGYEHARALHRLNEWTNESIRFYGVKVEVVKQAGGAPSAHGSARSYIPAAGAKRPHSNRERWPRTNCDTMSSSSHLLQSCTEWALPKRRSSAFHADRIFPSRLNPGIGYAAELHRGSAWVILSIRMEEKECTKRIFDLLKVNRAEIERSVDAGPAPDWHWLI